MQFLEAYQGKTILYAVLNWGLGHAARSIPIIHQLLSQDNSIIIYSDGEALNLLRREFPTLKYQEAPKYGMKYKYSNIWLNILLSSTRLAKAIRTEYKHTRHLIKTNNIDVIISDSRYGVRQKDISSVMITHQIQIHSKILWLGRLASKFHEWLLSRFDSCWIMDTPDNIGAGKLSEAEETERYKYIGIHSRLLSLNVQTKYDICVILSGPEPSRTKLEETLLKILPNLNYRICFIRGTTSHLTSNRSHARIDQYEMLTYSTLNTLICSSLVVICRSGYSTIMDLLKLGKKAVLIPTKGQTEQEYLACYHGNSEQFKVITEPELTVKNLSQAVDQLLN